MEIETIQELAGLLNKSPITRLELSGEEWRLELERPAPMAPEPQPRTRGGRAVRTAPPSALDCEQAAPNLTYVEAPVVGVFHEAAPAIRAGHAVRAGDLMGSIEALALRNDVRCPLDGEVTAVQVEDGQPVEYGQTLFTIGRFAEGT